MPAPHRLELTPAARDELVSVRDTAPRPYVRERAAALLKIADGAIAAEVARTGLLRPRDPDTLYRWVRRYRAEGIAGLAIRPGRGRKPAFPPQYPTAEAAREALLHLVRRDPRQCGIARSRWRLADLLAGAPWLELTTPQGLGQLLARLGISYHRGREYIHSPDPDYAAKLATVTTARQVVLDDPAHHVLLYLDEVTICRQPTIARAWEAVGRSQPLARRSQRSNTRTRILGALNAVTGAVHSVRAETITIPTLVRFFRELVDAYPDTTITVVLDNWSNHFHPDLLVALAPQHSPFPRYVPQNWSPQPHPAAARKWGGLALPIQLLPLPTYASWSNPIEKLWRKLRQELGHLHPWADDLPQLRSELDAWLHRYRQPSPDLLHYVGLGTRD